ncbi:hypothetical protein GUJ93_ZPchr0012g20935 [Zizania palustris]|uniref:Peptidase C83 domain-containing protein n=1 Tax=Zizania palustris TaxID=103762 RepID=A0A8J5WMY6_ZIZPA|nr:hypothetical protein GUJ93_ZPchr0012g20935 [Zizania palustris]
MPPPTPSSASPPRARFPRCGASEPAAVAAASSPDPASPLPQAGHPVCRPQCAPHQPREAVEGPLRWFDESMLDCCEHLDKVRSHGITFGKVACLVHCAGADVRRSAGQVHTSYRYMEYRCIFAEVLIGKPLFPGQRQGLARWQRGTLGHGHMEVTADAPPRVRRRRRCSGVGAAAPLWGRRSSTMCNNFTVCAYKLAAIFEAANLTDDVPEPFGNAST